LRSQYTETQKILDKKSKDYTKLLSQLDEDSSEMRSLREQNRALNQQISTQNMELQDLKDQIFFAEKKQESQKQKAE